MAWTDPSSINFNTGQVITETKLEQVTDNLLALVRAGDATGLAPTTSSVEIASTTSEMSLRTATAAGNTTGWLIPAGLIGTNRLVKLIAFGDRLFNSGTPTVRLRGYLRDGAGANTTLFDWTSGSFVGEAARRPWHIEAFVAGLGSASSQLAHMIVHIPTGTAGTETAGIAGDSYDSGQSTTHPVLIADDAASAVDMSAARYLDVTVTLSVNNASVAFRLKYATLTVL